MDPTWEEQVVQAAQELGEPIFGVADLASSARISGYAGRPCHQITVAHEAEGRRVAVTTGRHPLGGTQNLIRDLLQHSVPHKARLPWSVTLDERLVMVPVLGTPTQLRVVSSSTGQWVAASGFRKRHLLLRGSAGTSPDELELTLIRLRFHDDAEPRPDGQPPYS